MISVSVRAVSGLMTWRTTRGSSARRVSRPSASRVARTICGCSRRPPLATAENAETIWSAVTEISWPIDMVASESPDHCFGARSCPRLSPVRPTPVGTPKPNPEMYL
jgi:hypothetical protein